METMHMFWNALTSENQLIMSIISIPCTFLEVYLYMQIFTTILKIETDKKKKTKKDTCADIVDRSFYDGSTGSFSCTGACDLPI